jgi:hypothetical protein
VNEGKTFLQLVDERNAVKVAAASPPLESVRTAPHSAGSDSSRERAYAEKALRNECDLVAFATEGTRNDTLNRAAFNLTRFTMAGILTAELRRSRRDSQDRGPSGRPAGHQRH